MAAVKGSGLRAPRPARPSGLAHERRHRASRVQTILCMHAPRASAPRGACTCTVHNPVRAQPGHRNGLLPEALSHVTVSLSRLMTRTRPMRCHRSCSAGVTKVTRQITNQR
jgi:hypothetical protein